MRVSARKFVVAASTIFAIPSFWPRSPYSESSAMEGRATKHARTTTSAVVNASWIFMVLDSPLQRKIDALLMVFDDDVAEVGVGNRQRQIFVQEVCREYIPRVVFLRDAEIARLRPDFCAHRKVPAEQIRG